MAKSRGKETGQGKTTQPNGEVDEETTGLNQRTLRFLFVAFLFAFTMGKLAVAAYPVVDKIISGSFPVQHLARASHLTVAFFAITFSWVYWSAKAAEAGEVTDVLTWNYLVLAIDVLLVVFYYFIVQSADLFDKGNETPSARPESLLLICIYLVYLAWDFLHDIVVPYAKSDKAKRRRVKPRKHLWAIFVRCYASALSAVLALAIVLVAGFMEARLEENKARIVLVVVFLNLAEIANLVIFRTSKSGEDALQRLPKGKLHSLYYQPPRFKRNGKIDIKLKRRHLWGLRYSIAGYSVALLCVWVVWRTVVSA